MVESPEIMVRRPSFERRKKRVEEILAGRVCDQALRALRKRRAKAAFDSNFLHDGLASFNLKGRAARKRRNLSARGRLRFRGFRRRKDRTLKKGQ